MKKFFAFALCAAALFACKPEDRISVTPESVEFSCAGGTQQLSVSSNTEWRVTSSAASVTVSPSSGNGDMTVSVTMGENATIEDLSATLTFTAGTAPAVVVKVSQVAASVQFTKFSFDTNEDFIGSYGVAKFETLGAWTVEAADNLDITARSGNGPATVEIKTPANETDQEISYDIVFKSGISTQQETIVVPVASVKVGDYDYKVKHMPDGSWWMAEPLHYVPEGYTVSDNPEEGAHIWYPYAIDGGAAVAKTDDETIIKNGLLYDMYAVLGTNDLTMDNAASFEGAQGICPEGWHVPARDEYVALGGSSLKSTAETVAPKNEGAPFYDAAYEGGSVVKFNEGGWNFVASGFRQKTGFTAKASYNKTVIAEANTADKSYAGALALTYVASSSYYSGKEGSNCQFFALMSTFTAKLPGKLQPAYSHIENGVQVRCVRNAE